MIVSRRTILQVSALLGTASMFPLRAWADDHGTHVTPAEALAKLTEGNRKFVAGEAPPVLDKAHLASLAGGQEPFATIVSCSDSRVPPELIFEVGPGDLFVVRNAGNTASTVQSMGSIEYSVFKLKVPLILVLGHSKCGAVDAATAIVQSNATFPGSIGPMVEPILPAALAVRGHPGVPLDNGIVENVIRVRDRLRSPEQPILYPALRSGALMIVGAVYDIESRRVVFLPETAAATPAAH